MTNVPADSGLKDATLLDETLANSTFGNLFRYFVKNTTDEEYKTRTYVQFEQMARDFLTTLKGDTKLEEQKLLTTEFRFDESEINFSGQTSSMRKILFIVGLKALYSSVRNVIRNLPQDNSEFSELKRQASPPAAAYDLVGNNDLKITKSERGYFLTITD